MKREPTVDDVKAAWQQFLRSKVPFDFAKNPVLRLPLNPPLSMFDVVVGGEQPALTPVAIRYCLVTHEHGWLDGQRAKRIVGTVPNTDIHVVLETEVER